MSAPTSHFAVEQLSKLAMVTGSLRELGTLDLLQAIHDSKRSAALSIRSGEQHAEVYFRSGDIIEAELGSLRGERALYGALSWSEGSFSVEFRELDRADTMRTSTRRVLWEGRNWLEERARRIARLPDLTAVFAIDRGRLLAKLAELPDEMNLVLKLVDGRRSLREVLAQSELDELSTLSTLARLIGDGVIQDTAPSERASISVHPGMQLGLRQTLDYYEPQVPVILDPPPRASALPPRRTTDRTLRGMQAPTESRPDVDAVPDATTGPVAAPAPHVDAAVVFASLQGQAPLRATLRPEPPRRVRGRRRRPSGESTIPTRRARTFASSPDYAATELKHSSVSAAVTAAESTSRSAPEPHKAAAPRQIARSPAVRAVLAIGLVALFAALIALLAKL